MNRETEIEADRQTNKKERERVAVIAKRIKSGVKRQRKK
jgi:hypothetical protein